VLGVANAVAGGVTSEAWTWDGRHPSLRSGCGKQPTERLHCWYRDGTEGCQATGMEDQGNAYGGRD
jgi:hypothetical protein